MRFALPLVASAVVVACASTRPYEAVAPATPGAFECAVDAVGGLGYTVVELDRVARSFRAELRHGAGSSTAEQLVVEVVDGATLKVTAWIVHHYETFAAGTPQQRTQYESPSELTIEDADRVIETCTKDGDRDAEVDRRAPTRRGGG